MELVVRDGKFFTIGDAGAEFFHYKQNDIVFNAAQTESLFKYGGIKGANPRGKMLASGTAFANGSARLVGRAFGGSSGEGGDTEIVVGTNSVTGEVYTKSSSNSDKFKETIDWIETALKRIQREIDNLDQKASNTYKSWGSRNEALASQINMVGVEIAKQNQAADKYLAAANGVGLKQEYVDLIKSGAIDIETITDEGDKEKIESYKKYYESYLNCIDAVEELKETEADLYAQRFENVQAQYDSILQGYEHTESMLNEYISQAEEKGYLVSTKYYDALINNEKQNIAQLKNEQAALIAERDRAVADGEIAKSSEDWYDQCAAIDEVTQAIESANTKLIEYNNAIRDLDFEKFELIQDYISDVTDEADFLIELMSNKDLYDDKGNLTEQGASTLGLHAQKHNTYMYSADDYGNKIAEIDNKIASGDLDPYDQEVINKRREYVELQRECILNAEQEKQAISDLVSEGIDKELDALSELIDKKNEELEAEKDLYEYSKQVQEQTETIASLRKEMAAYENDDSETAKAKIQELKVSLQDAETELQETEWDRYIDQQSQLLTSLYDEYELLLNQRIDDTNYLLTQVIAGVNATTLALGEDGTITNALGAEGAIAKSIVDAVSEQGGIQKVLNKEVTAVGTSLSNAMDSIWTTENTGTNSILSVYSSNFQAQSTTLNTALGDIKKAVNKMAGISDKSASDNIGANKTSGSDKKDPTKNTGNTTPTPKPNANKSSGDGKAEVGDKVTFANGKYYYDSQGKKPLGSKNLGKEVYITKISTHKWSTYPYHISTGKTLGTGDLGWVKKKQIEGYATGKKKISNNEYAWTQEKGQEFIVRPSDGAILTPVAKGDSVLNATASGNIWSMANNPAEFIKNNLGLDSTNIPNGANVNNQVTQNFENINFHLPNVHSYNELISEMQHDPKFEKLIQAMTVDQIAGKSKLGKNKAIR